MESSVVVKAPLSKEKLTVVSAAGFAVYLNQTAMVKSPVPPKPDGDVLLRYSLSAATKLAAFPSIAPPGLATRSPLSYASVRVPDGRARELARLQETSVRAQQPVRLVLSAADRSAYSFPLPELKMEFR